MKYKKPSAQDLQLASEILTEEIKRNPKCLNSGFSLMPTKTKAPINFRIKRSPRTKQFRCVIVGGNGEPTFVGEPCKNRKDVHDTIASHIRAILTGNYVMPDTFDGSLELAKKLTKKCCGKGCKKTKPVKWGRLNRQWP